MKNFLFLSILCSLMVINVTTLAEITQVNDLFLFATRVNQADSNALVIFDVDHVLIMPTDEYSLNRNPYRKKLWQNIKNKYGTEEASVLRSIAVSSAKWQLVDPSIISTLSHLKSKNIPTIALTSLTTGKVGIIEKMEDLRIRELKSVGISFASLSPLQGELSITELASAHGTPMLKEGIIFTAENDKATVLEYILRYKSYYPKTIIFIDDQLTNLEALEKLCTRLNIKFYGFHYKAVSLMTTYVIDEQLEKLRFQILEKEYRWLSYKEMAEKMNISCPLAKPLY